MNAEKWGEIGPQTNKKVSKMPDDSLIYTLTDNRINIVIERASIVLKYKRSINFQNQMCTCIQIHIDIPHCLLQDIHVCYNKAVKHKRRSTVKSAKSGQQMKTRNYFQANYESRQDNTCSILVNKDIPQFLHTQIYQTEKEKLKSLLMFQSRNGQRQ